MYYRIKDEKIYDWADYRYAQDCLATDIVDKSNFDLNFDRYSVEDGVLIDISTTESYVLLQSEKEREKNKFQLQAQIDELDKKRIRAIAEPALKDAQSGQTWLGFYTTQIQALRAQM